MEGGLRVALRPIEQFARIRELEAQLGSLSEAQAANAASSGNDAAVKDSKIAEKASVLSRISTLRDVPRRGELRYRISVPIPTNYSAGLLPMPLTPEQHASIAASYDKAASDLSVAEERRAEFAKRADWFRQLARLETKRGAVRQTPDPSIPHTLPAPESERKSNPKYLLASLWLIGSVLYMAGTLLFTIAVNPAEENAKTTTISKGVSAASNPQQTQLGSKQPVIADDLEPAATASPPALAPLPATALAMVDRPHAISPDEPAYEFPALTVPPSLANEEPGSPTAPSAPIKEAAAPQPGEALEVTETGPYAADPPPAPRRSEPRVPARHSKRRRAKETGCSSWIPPR